jgi:hypothetical protein
MRPSRVLALIVVLLVLPATAWAQQTIYGCVKNNNGQIRIVAAGEACLPSEHAVQWALGSGATAAAPPVAAPGPLRLLDQAGVSVGVFASPNYAARLIGDMWVGLPVTATGFQITDAPMTYYQAAGCAGDAYLPVDMSNMLRTGLVTAGTGGQLTFMYPGKPDVGRTTIQSYGFFAGSTWMCYATTPASWTPLFGKVVSVDVSTFQAPFKIVQ